MRAADAMAKFLQTVLAADGTCRNIGTHHCVALCAALVIFVKNHIIPNIIAGKAAKLGDTEALLILRICLEYKQGDIVLLKKFLGDAFICFRKKLRAAPLSVYEVVHA